MNYNKELLERNLYPEHRGELPDYSFRKTVINSSCGDKLTIFLKIDKSNKIINASFTGHGCAISTVAADLMLSEIIGKNLDSIEKIYQNYQKMLLMEDFKDIGSLKILNDVSRMPARVNCAKLPFKILEDLRKI